MLSLHTRSRLVRFVNVVLVTAAGGMALMLGRSLMEHQSIKEEPSGTEQAGVQNEARDPRTERSNRSKRFLPDLAQFQIIVERDPFRVPLENLKVVSPPPVVPSLPQVAMPKPPLPPLTVTLSGTIVIGDERKAILKDGKQEDVYSVGQTVAGGVLAAVEYDRVAIARGGERTELLLKSAMRGDAPVLAALPSQGPVPAAGDRTNKTPTVGKPLFATPAFARYPGVGTQSKGDHDR